MTGALSSGTLPALRPGTVLAGRLKLIRPVGEGGMGAVWVARNTATGADVAIKMLRPGRQDDGEAAERFRHEAKLGAMLTHRNITRVFDLVEGEGGLLILVMELLRGETLRSYAKRVGRVPQREAVAIVVAVLSGLQHAHEHGVVHRDLKPTNILLHVDPDGMMTPKLLDFGIAKAKDSSVDTRTGDTLGTPSYMSPEQVRATDLDGRSDLFSCGVVLYEIITGENPFGGGAATAILAQVLELEVDPDPRIEPRVWLELQRALAKQAYERHASAKEFASALSAAVGETEQALVRSLRRELPSAPATELPQDSVDTIAVEPRVGRGGVPGRFVVAIAVGVALVLVVAVVAALRSSSAEAPREPSPARTTVEVGPGPTPTAAPPDPPRDREGPGASPVTRSLSASGASPRPPRLPPVPRAAGSAPAKPLARTPGF